MDDSSQNLKKTEEEVSSEDPNSARHKLIVVARKLFAEKGLAGVSTREIAGEAGLNISLISYYFGGKEGLYRAVIEQFAQEASGRMHQLLGSLDLENLDREGFKSTMKAIVSGMIPMKMKESDINTILQRELMSGLPHAKETFNHIFVPILETIVSLYHRGQKNGFIRKDVNPYVVFLSMTHSTDAFANIGHCKTSISEKVPQIPRDLNEYTDQIYKIFVEGVMI